MNFFKKIISRTPETDKRRGKIATTIGSICGAILATGLITSVPGLIVLTIGAVAFGSKAVYHASKVDETIK